MSERVKSIQVLTMNTLAFTVCFAVWMLNGVLVTFLVEQDAYKWTESQMGWLIGLPVLTGSIMRLPIGILSDKFGGRPVYFWLMIASAIPTYLLSLADSFGEFLWAGLGFGLAGASFAVGVAYTSVWFPKERQGTMLGIFGMGNIGAALTSFGAPLLLMRLTGHGANLEAWRLLPKFYAALLVLTAFAFYFLTYPKKVASNRVLGLRDRLQPLANLRVWRFGLYYFLLFGGFVALSQWLIPYYVNVYLLPVAIAGPMAAMFSLPSGAVRAFGGWVSDRVGARRVMYWVLAAGIVCFALLSVPRMEITLPGKGVVAKRPGTVQLISDSQIHVGEAKYAYHATPASTLNLNQGVMVWPQRVSWQEPVVQQGDQVGKRQLMARGVSKIYFQANVWIFSGLVFFVAFSMGLGMAAVYRHIPDYFPNAVGVVGGTVGVLGGLGGFVCPIIFGYLLEATGVWTTCWLFLGVLGVISLVWMHLVIQKMMREQAPALMRQMETQEPQTQTR